MKKQKIGRIIDNNIYMLKFVAKHTPDFLFCMAAEGIIWGMIHSFSSVIFVKLLFDSLGEGSFTKSVGVIGAMAVFSIATYFFHVWYWNIYNPKAHQRLHLKMQKSLFEKARSLDLACYDDPEFYNDFVWAVNESDRRVGAIMEDTGKLINRVVATVTIIGVLLTVDAFSIILILAVVAISAVINRIRQKLRLSMRQESVPIERKSSYIGRVYRLPEYAKEIRMGNVPSLLNEKYNNSIDDRIKVVKKYNNKTFIANNTLLVLKEVLLSIGITVILLYKLIYKKSILLGDFAAANNAVWKLYWQINSLVDFLMKFPEHSLYTEKFRAFMEYKPKVCSGDTKTDKIENIEFRNVGFSYKTEKVLDNVSFNIKRGEKIAVVGYNGAGKSTLIKLLMHFYDVTDGQILINGTDIKEYSINEYREKIGAVFQDYRIFSATVAENVMADKVTENTRQSVEESLKKSGFYEKLLTLEKGIDSILTREFSSDGVELSGGEGQKIAIARAFAHDFELIIMDEPSSALDPMAEYELNQTVKNNLSDKTVIFISHRLSTTRMADRIIMFDKGRIIEEGSHEELMKLDGKYAEMFNLQAEKYRKREAT